MKKAAFCSFLLFVVCAADARAQSDVCPPDVFCQHIDVAEVSLARAGIALSGGNPVPGASSTLGMRLRALPRLSVAGRVTGARMKFTDLTDPSDPGEFSSIARSLNVDVAVGIFGGFSLLPTVGGFGSIDLLGSYGKLSLSDDDGFQDDPTSWAIGARLGILRESFTAPGISVSAMYRKIGDFDNLIDDPSIADDETVIRLENNRALSLRATVGKRILMLGATAGIGYDKYSSDMELGFAMTPPVSQEIDRSATTIFGNLSWTMLILNIVGEGGVQRIKDGDSAPYGSLAVRIAL